MNYNKIQLFSELFIINIFALTSLKRKDEGIERKRYDYAYFPDIVGSNYGKSKFGSSVLKYVTYIY